MHSATSAIACIPAAARRDLPEDPTATIVENHLRSTIFQEPWWLDIVAPGRWAEVTSDRGYLRYGHGSRMIFRLSKIPPLTRIVGPVIQVEGKKTETRQRAVFSAVSELLDKMPAFDYVRFRLDPSVTDVLPFQAHGFRTSAEHTFRADCRQPEATIWSEMRDKTRNTVRRAQDSLSIVATDDAKAFKDFYAANLGDGKSHFDLHLIPELFAGAHSRGRATILAAVDQRGDIHAQTFFVWDDHACYYFLSSRDQAIAHTGAVSALVWAGMQQAHRLGLIFDFDGITSASRYQFMVAFGGKPATRFVVAKGAPLYMAQHGVREFGNQLIGRTGADFL